ncbi:MAG: hypothetical protein ACE5F1_07000 [Planctomycetota bacterium]
MPPLEVSSLSGSTSTLAFEGSEPGIVAFLRPDQEDSRRVLELLEELALDPKCPPASLTVIGTKTHGSWTSLSKGLPRRLRLYLDSSELIKTLGIIVLPSIAVLDKSGRLRRSYVLHESKLRDWLVRDLERIETGGGAAGRHEPDSKLALFEEISMNAGALEVAGKLREALRLRLQQLRLGVRSAEVHASLGRLYFLLGESGKSVAHLQRSRALGETVSVRVWLGRALAQAGELDEAEKELGAVAPLSPDKAVVHRSLAEIAKRRGNIDLALEHIKSAIAALKKKNASKGGGSDARR